MIKGVEKTIEWIRLNELKKFTVKTSNGDNNNIFKTGDSETFEDSIKRFQDVMRISYAGKFIIQGHNGIDKNPHRGLFTEEFSNFEGYSPDIQPGQAQIGNLIPLDEVDRKIAEALEKDRKDRLLHDLQEENKELQKELQERDKPLNNFLGMILPHATDVLSKAFPKPVPIGVGDLEPTEVESEQTAQEQAERLQNCLIAWNEFEPDICDIIEGLIKLHSENPAQYDMAKKMLP